MRKHLACVLLPGVLAACGGSIALEDLQTGVISAECDWAAKCRVYPTSDQCNRDILIDIGRDQAGVGAGRISYDGGAASDCLDAIRGADCRNESLSGAVGQDSCRRALAGTVPVNGACFESDDCADHGGCTFPTTCNRTTTCCSGTCGPARPVDVAVGQACQSTSVCVSGAYCAQSQPVRTCLLKLTNTGAACDAADACAPPLRCLNDPAPATSRTCRTPADEGATCDPQIPGSCANIYDACDATSRTCVALPGPGQSCVTTQACVGAARCLNGQCVAEGDLGQACPVSGCAGSLQCVNNMCTAPAAPLACP